MSHCNQTEAVNLNKKTNNNVNTLWYQGGGGNRAEWYHCVVFSVSLIFSLKKMISGTVLI